jgi:PAS domain S-box-containing protein
VADGIPPLDDELTLRPPALSDQAARPAQPAMPALTVVLAALPDAVLMIDPTLAVTAANAAATRQFGVAERAPLPRLLTDWLAGAGFRRPDGSPVTLDELAIVRALREGSPATAEIHSTGPDGPARIYLCQAGPLRDAAGRIVGAICTSRDVTEERREAERLRVMARAVQTMLGTTDLDQVAGQVVRQVRALLQAEAARLWLVQPEGDELRPVAVHGPFPAEYQAERLTLAGSSPTALAARTLTMQTAERAGGTDGRDPASGPGGPAGLSWLSVPLVVRRRLVGVLDVVARGLHPFGEPDRQAVQALAQQFAAAIEGAYFFGQSDMQRRWLRTIIGELPEGVIVAEAPGGRILAANPAAERLLGMTLRDGLAVGLTTLSFRRIDGARLPPEEQPLNRTLLHGESCLAVEVRYDPPDGPPRILLLNTAPLRDILGIPHGGVAVFQDITDRRAEQQRRDDFLSVASHELKTPLTSIKGYADLINRRLMRDGQGARHQRSLAIITHQIDRMTRIVDDMLDLSRLERGRFEIKFGLVNMNDIVGRAVEQAGTAAVYHTLRVRLPPHACLVRADGERLEQALSNLLSNAFKYSPEGSAVTVRLAVEEGEAVVAVTDQGAGIAPEHQIHLFERYYRVPGTAGGGLGLGLFIAHEIVARHGGRLWVESAAGRGSTFSVALPLVPSDE